MSDLVSSLVHPRNTVIFDLDGTLIDSVQGITASMNTALREMGRRPLDRTEVLPMIGDGGLHTVKLGLNATGGSTGVDLDAVFARWTRAYTEDQVVKIEAYPRVLQTLELLTAEGLNLGLCTNKTRAVTMPILAAAGLARFFDIVVTPEDTPFRKPDGRHILATIAAMGAEPTRCAYVGDSEIDAAAAASAGIPFILVTYGYRRGPIAEIRADALIDDFGDLPAALTRLS